ncbi:hypothetical protein ORI89_18745 [Sphingobacterium sp. UT-1RO-CII-1]|uniref:hypothetical protein n=1 Tax=Sphingobacterium sp. UT-1RO-CII-1 TaxID=2995225 RepID=UPI00227D1A5C|nr:hypothetical protein [Sphingobacterium sp. UT-1RO-CII-1]MCY4781696.1 hypothetical protein [Sphingobacterium sp. UT-1RO-CII-1]
MMDLLTLTDDEITAELCRKSFFEFVKEFWDVIIPETPVYNWHIPFLCDQLQETVFRVKQRLPKLYDEIINIPPGTTKSTIVTVMLPAWAWAVDPTLRIVTGSYSASLATDHAIKSRDIIKSEKYRRLFPEVEIKRDQDNKTHYKNTSNGERYATSVGGTITGIHAHIILIDDPLNPKQAASEAERLTANEWMDVTLSSRKVNKEMTPTILVMQRLHEEDCTGNWLSKQGKALRHFKLPGKISSGVEPIPAELAKHYVDGNLDPVRLSDKALNDARIDLGSYGYAGQYDQNPAPADGGIWKRWFIPIPDKELDELIPKLKQYGTDWDLAYTDKDTNSASAYVTSGEYEKNMYITDIGFDWLEFPQLIDYMKKRKAPHHIEAKASGKSAKQTLVNQGISAKEVNPLGGDKEAKANMATPYVERGSVYVRASLLEFLYTCDKQGILKFPNNNNDDLQDALCQAIQRVLGKKKMFVI